jgi:hypothetical protein
LRRVFGVLNQAPSAFDERFADRAPLLIVEFQFQIFFPARVAP